MKLIFKKLSIADDKKVQVSFDGGESYEAFEKETAKNGIPIPDAERCDSFDKIVLNDVNPRNVDLNYYYNPETFDRTKLDSRVKKNHYSRRCY